jgi:hypothetical protein
MRHQILRRYLCTALVRHPTLSTHRLCMRNQGTWCASLPPSLLITHLEVGRREGDTVLDAAVPHQLPQGEERSGGSGGLRIGVMGILLAVADEMRGPIGGG